MRASLSWSYPSLPPPTVHIFCPWCWSLVVMVELCITAGGPVRQFPPPMMLTMVSPCPSVFGRSVSASWGRTGTSSVVGVSHSSPYPFSVIISLLFVSVCVRFAQFLRVVCCGWCAVVGCCVCFWVRESKVERAKRGRAGLITFRSLAGSVSCWLRCVRAAVPLF